MPRSHGTAANSALAALKFKKNNPEAYKLLAQTALELKRRGSRVSAARVFEAARVIPPREPNAVPFKLDNSLRPAIARLLMVDYPELEGAFETRRAASDSFDFAAAQKQGMAE